MAEIRNAIHVFTRINNTREFTTKPKACVIMRVADLALIASSPRPIKWKLTEDTTERLRGMGELEYKTEAGGKQCSKIMAMTVVSSINIAVLFVWLRGIVFP